jgi:hypothetical protein
MGMSEMNREELCRRNPAYGRYCAEVEALVEAWRRVAGGCLPNIVGQAALEILALSLCELDRDQADQILLDAPRAVGVLMAEFLGESDAVQ